MVAMEVLQLHPEELKASKNFRCLLVGASGTGKSFMMEQLIKNKKSIFQEPGYGKIVFCSPHMSSSAFTFQRDLDYKERLKTHAKPADMLFFDYIPSLEELKEIAETTPLRTCIYR